MKVTIYSTPTCPYCIMAKNYFRGKSVEFEDIDVSQDKKKAKEMVKISGQMGVPVILIDKEGPPAGRRVIIGFDQPEIENLLNG